MNVFSSFLLGLVQGVAEFLPISSSGHLAIAQNLLHIDAEVPEFFDVLLHLGTLGAVFVAYWQDIKDICDSVPIPITAIGGVKLDNMLELRGTGVDGVAIVSGIFAAPNIEQATAQLLAQARKLVEA